MLPSNTNRNFFSSVSEQGDIKWVTDLYSHDDYRTLILFQSIKIAPCNYGSLLDPIQINHGSL